MRGSDRLTSIPSSSEARKETLTELVNKYFNPYEEPITKLDMVTGPAWGSSSSGYSGGVSAGTGDERLGRLRRRGFIMGTIRTIRAAERRRLLNG